MSHVRKVKHLFHGQYIRRPLGYFPGTAPRALRVLRALHAASQTYSIHYSLLCSFLTDYRPPEKSDQPRGDIARQLRAPVEDRQNRDHDQPRPDHPVHARQIVPHKNSPFLCLQVSFLRNTCCNSRKGEFFPSPCGDVVLKSSVTEAVVVFKEEEFPSPCGDVVLK